MLVVGTDIFSFFSNKILVPNYTVCILTEFMSVAELDQWALETNLKRYLIQPSSRELGQHWATVMVSAKIKGRPISAADAWIAATALFFGVPLVTHNAGDYAGVNSLQILTESK